MNTHLITVACEAQEHLTWPDAAAVVGGAFAVVTFFYFLFKAEW